MNVKELMRELEKADPEAEVLAYTEDQELLSQDQGLRIFEVTSAETHEGERIRLPHGAGLRFGRTDFSARFFLLEVTSDF